MSKYVYAFAEGNKDLKDLLGGKGANLAEMAGMGLPVPPGFTVSTEACRAYLDTGVVPAELNAQVDDHLRRPGGGHGQGGSAPRTTRCSSSVRSGSKFSMPGMMETVLDVGLNDEFGDRAREGRRRRAVRLGLLPSPDPDVRQDRSGDRRRRISTRRSTPRSRPAAPSATSDLDAADLQQVVVAYKGVVRDAGRPGVPAGPAGAARPRDQRGLRLVELAARPALPAPASTSRTDLGTAVNVMAMVFGNLGPDSGSGVAFTRDPATGERGRLRRLPAQRPGRGRRRRHPQHDGAGPARAARRRVVPRPDGDHGDAGAALPRPVRHRVHDRARAAVDAADPRGQADRGRGVRGRRASSSTRA